MRKAAANVFLEQNVLQREARDELYDDAMQLSKDEARPGAMPPPAEVGLAGSVGGGKSDGLLNLPAQAPRRAYFASSSPIPQSGLKTSEELQLEKEPIRVRETGFLFWKRVIVPPNAYVVHTRIGKTQPVTIGLGCSFRINPNTDAYLVVPAAMQTIGVVANCISKEKQGINVLAYVQWQINDFAVAYRKLDFSDSRNPLGIVNAQLREQAEAAIKDKIATMSVEEVLTDKEPVIEELTTRLKAVSEGRSQGAQSNDGLGIKIVTVQIKEALISSQRLWEDLQAPFRYEQAKKARISYLLTQDEVRTKELETRQLTETSEAETLVAIERIKQGKQTEALDVRLTEEATRFVKEQETTRQKIQLEEQTILTKRESELRLEAESNRVEQERRLILLRRQQEQAIEQARLNAESQARQKALQTEQVLQELLEETRLAEAKVQSLQQQYDRDTTLKTQEATFKQLVQDQQDQLESKVLEAGLSRRRQETQVQLELEEAVNQLKLSLSAREIEISREQQQTRNLINERDLSSRLIEKLPELAAAMPEIHELKVLQTGDGTGAFDALTDFLAKIIAVGQNLGLPSLSERKPDGD